MPITDEEACRKYIIVFGAPCPCEIDHPEMTQEEALAGELRDAARLAGGGDPYTIMAAHLLKHFTFADKQGRTKEDFK